MATRIQVRRLANPRRKVNAKRRNATRRRKMSPKQIRIFGTKAQKAALKRKRNKRNPVRKVNVAKRVNRRRRNKRSPNPALVVTLGAMNPRRRKRRNKPVAKAKANRRRRRVATNPRRTNRRRNVRRNARRVNRRRRNRRNPATRIVVVSPKANRRRRRNTRHSYARRRVHHRRRRNPSIPDLFGAPLFGKNALEMVGGGLVGLAAAKFIPTMIPGVSTFTGSNIGRVVVSGISAVVGGWLGSKVSPQFGQGVLFGGMIQTVSIALNAFLPTAYAPLAPYTTLGDLMNGGFSIPQNPLRVPYPAIAPPPPPPAAAPAGSQARITMNGLARAFGPAY
jgi:hypothetical protein